MYLEIFLSLDLTVEPRVTLNSLCLSLLVKIIGKQHHTWSTYFHMHNKVVTLIEHTYHLM